MSSGGDTFGHPLSSHRQPTRDTAPLSYAQYGPGHEKFPSWPMPAAAQVPVAIKTPPTGGSHRSKSWTDHTNYPKEQTVPYTRPYMRKGNNFYPVQLRPVIERGERRNAEPMQYIQPPPPATTMERRKNSFGGMTSPPERDSHKRDPSKMGYRAYGKESITPLTQADLEEYTKKFDESTLIQHHKQSSYAQSEGYHSYVSSSDSSTPFIDSLRRDIDVSGNQMMRVCSWDGESVATTRPGSVSSSETLKWHGSLSDMSEVSNSSGTSPRQLIVHSAKVQTPQKQSSESVFYMHHNVMLPSRSHSQRLLQHQYMQQNSSQAYPSAAPPRKTVAEYINIYEGKNIKAIQKKALLSFYERHQDQMKKDTRRPPETSQSFREPHNPSPKRPSMDKGTPQSPIVTCDSPNSIFQGPVIMGPSISLDEWVPERPPKNRNLLLNVDASRRQSSPELPLPSPPLPASDEDIMYKCEDPFPPPPEKMRETPCQYPTRPSEGYGSRREAHKATQHQHRRFPNAAVAGPGCDNRAVKVPSNKMIPKHPPIRRECDGNMSPHKAPSQGQFRAEPLMLRYDCGMPPPPPPTFRPQSHKSLENINKSFEATDQYRAELTTVQNDYPPQTHGPFHCSNVGEDVRAVDSSSPSKVPQKIHRSKSESNRLALSPRGTQTTYNMHTNAGHQNQGFRSSYNNESWMNAPPAYGHHDAPAGRNDQNKYVNGAPAAKSFDDVSPKRDDPPTPPEKKFVPSVAKKVDIQRASVKAVNVPADQRPQCQETVEDEEAKSKRIDEEVTRETEPDSNTSPNEKVDGEVDNATTSETDVTDMLKALTVRKRPSEESFWRDLTAPLLRCLPENHPTRTLLSEFGEYDPTAQMVLNAFLIDESDTADEIQWDMSKDFPVTNIDYEPLKLSNTENLPKDELDFKNHKEKAEQHLIELIKVMEEQLANLEAETAKNEELGKSIVSVLEKPYSARVSRLMADIGVITLLMCSLVSRFRRISKTLEDAPPEFEDRNILSIERDRLIEKLKDAKSLKNDIDNTSKKFLKLIESRAESATVADYKNFIGTKIRLVIRLHDSKDRTDLAKRLVASLNQDPSIFPPKLSEV